MKRILIISVSGIGNTIMQGPFIEAILNDNRQNKVDILFGNEAMATVLQNHSQIHRHYTLPASMSMAKTLSLINLLRKQNYDIVVSCFPSNRAYFHILPFLIGAKRRIIHSYHISPSKLSFLSNENSAAQAGTHDIEQNLALLNHLNIQPRRAEVLPFFDLSEENVRWAKEFFTQGGGQNGLHPDNFILGLHAGAGPLQEKKWPIGYFAELGKWLLAREGGGKILIFGGPEEIHDKKILAQEIGTDKTEIIETSLGNTAALMQYCNLFISNDTGLMHVAAACNVPTLGIFGPSDWRRTAPRGPEAHFIRSSCACAPCLSYPLAATKASITCPHNYKCLHEITVEIVFRKACEIIDTMDRSAQAPFSEQK